MVELFRSFLKLAEDISGASVFTLVVLGLFIFGYSLFTLAKIGRKFAKRCGVHKSLLVGYVQDQGELSPSEAINETNKITKEALRDLE